MRKLKRTTEEVAEYFKLQGCELLDDYKGAQIKMKYRCSCGNESTINWNHFSNGKRCGHCTKWGQKKKKTLEEVKQIFIDRGCEFLDGEYKGVEYKHNYRCKCGRLAQISLTGFHIQKQNCQACGLEKNKGNKHHSWIEDREEARLKNLFRKKCYKALRSTLLAVGKNKVGKTTELLGYTPEQLREHITNHPNWAKVKDGDWHIDHIFPIQAFVDHDIKDIKLINCLDNLQPLSQSENNEKWGKYDKDMFINWLNKARDVKNEFQNLARRGS